MAQLDGPGLHAEIDLRFPDNTTEKITPPIVRAFLHNLVDSALLAASDKIALSLPLTLAQARALLTAAPPRVGAGQFYAVTGNWNGSGTTSTVYVEGLNNLAFQLEGVLFSAGTYSKVLVDVLVGTAVSATMLRSLHTFRWHTQAEGVGNYGGESLDQLKGEELFAQAQVLVEFWRDNPLDLTSDVIYNQQFIVQYDPRPTPEYYGWRTSGGAANNAGRIGLKLSKVENPYTTVVKQYFANQNVKAGDVRFASDVQGVAFYEATQDAVAPVPAPVRGQTTANWKPAASPPPSTAPVDAYNRAETDQKLATVRTTLALSQTVTSNYTLQLSDAGQVVPVAAASGLTAVITIPAAADVAFPVGTVLFVRRKGAGIVGVAAASGVTLRTPAGAGNLAADGDELSLHKEDTNTWFVKGGVS